MSLYKLLCGQRNTRELICYDDGTSECRDPIWGKPFGTPLLTGDGQGFVYRHEQSGCSRYEAAQIAARVEFVQLRVVFTIEIILETIFYGRKNYKVLL